MKTYPITGANGKPYTLGGVVDSVKEVLEDIVQAREKLRNHRQLKKKLIPMDVFILEQQSVQAIHFTTEPVLTYIATPEGNRQFLRELLIAGGKCDEPTEADVEAVCLAQGNENSPAWIVARQIWEDAYPKGQTPPLSTVSATSGGGSSTTNQSAETLTPSAA